MPDQEHEMEQYRPEIERPRDVDARDRGVKRVRRGAGQHEHRLSDLRDEHHQELEDLRDEHRQELADTQGEHVHALTERDAQLWRLCQRLKDAEHELADLRSIRDALTPASLPRPSGLEVAVSYLPASGGVGGDFYLVTDGPADSTILVVGDVAGRGVQAARRAAFVRTAIATAVPFTHDPCRLLELANQALVEHAGTSEEFVTAACLSYRPAERELSWAFAGHLPPLWLDTGQPLVGVKPGLPLGIENALGCTGISRCGLEPGTGVLLFTDGLVEARRDRVEFGLPRLSFVVGQLTGAAPDEIIGGVLAELEDFTAGESEDDLCLLVARLRPDAG